MKKIIMSLLCGFLFAVVTTTVFAQTGQPGQRNDSSLTYIPAPIFIPTQTTQQPVTISIPSPKKSVTFAQLKDSTVLSVPFHKELIAKLKTGKFGKDTEFDGVVSISEIWTVTDVPGRKESQELFFYKIKDGTEHVFLAQKGTTTDSGNGKLKSKYGDSKEADALFGK